MADPLTIPSAPDHEHRILGWCKEALEEGEAFLKAQRGYDRFQEIVDAIMGNKRDLRASSLSSTSVNHMGKVASDLTAMLTDVKPFWEYKTENQRFKEHVQITGKLSTHWWLNRFIDLKFADGLRYALAAGSAYYHLFYNTSLGDLDVSAEDPRDVIPVRPPSTSLSLQECFAVIHRVKRTVNYLRKRFPDKAGKIFADSDGSAVGMSGATRAGRLYERLGSPFSDRLFNRGPEKDIPRIPTANLYTLYVDDQSTNKSGKPIRVGDEGANWSYVVLPGDPIYPRKRCIMFTSNAILYDGPNVYWHGLYPYCKLTLDPWPWSWTGKPILADLLPIQAALDRTLRIVDDCLEKIARPDVIADKNAISRAELDKIDTRRAGVKFHHRPMGGKGLLIQPHPGLPSDVYKAIEYYEQKLYELPGIRDLSAMMRLNQIPSAETIERILEAMAPSVRLRSRIIEAFMREFATMTAWNFAQFYTLPLRLSILGPEGITSSDWDFDPESFIPDYAHSSDYGNEGLITQDALTRGPLPRYDRAKEFFRQVSYHIAPASLLNASEIETQMKYLQLSRAGLIDHWTLLEVLNVPNVGNPPEGANTITERLIAEQTLGLNMNVSAAGRKSSGQELPKQKSSGAVSESG